MKFGIWVYFGHISGFHVSRDKKVKTIGGSHKKE